MKRYLEDIKPRQVLWYEECSFGYKGVVAITSPLEFKDNNLIRLNELSFLLNNLPWCPYWNGCGLFITFPLRLRGFSIHSPRPITSNSIIFYNPACFGKKKV